MESRIENSSTTEELQGARLDKLVSDLKALIQRAEQKAKEQARAADRVVRDHPYQTIGLAFGLGLLIAILARRK